MNDNLKVGIEAVGYYVPQLYLPIPELAKARNIDPAKLEYGLGLKNMAIPDVDEDPVSMAANAVLQLAKNENLEPAKIARIYVGTESAVDAAKPIATYVHKILEDYFAKNKSGDLLRADAVDFTFACIGGVDALQNCLDFVRLNPDKQAIVVTTDFAKYTLGSGGEYTQGAGAMALLINANPRLLAFNKNVGVATESVFDFFKPRRLASRDQFSGGGVNDEVIEIHTDEPIFDGQYSNDCYKAKLKEAYFDFKSQAHTQGRLFDQWELLAFHLPYAFQGRRMFSEIFAIESGVEDLSTENLKVLSKSDEYKSFVSAKIAPTEAASSEIGNMYTSAIFMAMLSGLLVAKDEGRDLAGHKIGFLAYGSGAKSKVLEAEVQPNWIEKLNNIDLFEVLNNRQALDYSTYEKLHRKALKEPIARENGYIRLTKIEQEKENLIGARYYSDVD